MTHDLNSPEDRAVLLALCKTVTDHPQPEGRLKTLLHALLRALALIEEQAVELELRKSRVRVASLIAREMECDDGVTRGDCQHVSKGMCQGCTFDWMVTELQRLRDVKEGQAARIAELTTVIDDCHRRLHHAVSIGGYDQLADACNDATRILETTRDD